MCIAPVPAIPAQPGHAFNRSCPALHGEGADTTGLKTYPKIVMHKQRAASGDFHVAGGGIDEPDPDPVVVGDNKAAAIGYYQITGTVVANHHMTGLNQSIQYADWRRVDIECCYVVNSVRHNTPFVTAGKYKAVPAFTFRPPVCGCWVMRRIPYY